MGKPTLDQVVKQLVSLGERDPHAIAEKIVERHGGETWFQKELVSYAGDFLTDMARRQLGSERRTAERALRVGSPGTAATLGVKKVWIPGEGWKRFGDCTSSDLRAKAEFYLALGRQAFTRAAWYQQVAAQIESEGVGTVGGIVDLPELPDADTEAGILELVA